jgi:heavy metal sensor kinase
VSDIRRPRFFDAQGNKNPNDPVSPFETQTLSAALHGQMQFADTQYQGEPIRVVSAPMRANGRVIGAVQVAQEVRNIDLLWRAQVGTLALFLPLAILAAAAGAYALTGRTLSPIRRLTRAASEISHSDLSRRLDVSGDDEIGELAATFNKMLARLETSFMEIEGAYAKMARAYDQQQRFTADAAHELRTPLTRLRLATSSALQEAESPEEMKRALQTADRAANSMTRLVQDLLMLAKADSGQLPLHLESVDLRVVVADALENVCDGRPIDSAFDERPLMISADAEHLQRVITNLTENACRHTPADRSIRVETVRAKDYAVVSIRDTGEGIAAEHLPRIFDRFYRADAARTRGDGGSGLGLAICKNLVEAHGGRIEIESSPGVGTTVRTIFPLISAPPALQTKSS